MINKNFYFVLFFIAMMEFQANYFLKNNYMSQNMRKDIF